MHVYLRTRGVPRKLDYGFLGAAPGSRWWDTYSELTATERPCLLAVTSKGRWRVLISGVPSTRTDSVGTLVYYTLVLDGSPSPAGTVGPRQDRPTVLALASRWLDDIARHPEGRGVLSELLDGLCSSAEVDRLLAARHSELTTERAELTARLATALASLSPAPSLNPAPSVPSAQDSGAPSPVLLTERWIAGRTAPGADAAFLARLSSLLSGEDGQAHLLNLVSSAEDITTLPQKPGLLAVLIEGGMVGDPAMPAEALPKLPSEVVASAPKARWRAAMVPTVLTALILLLVALVLVAGNWT
ncbi:MULTISPECIES: hypothetical protein [Streptomyces]|uniref:Uncharacterized protein n=2 Tax=Streptomyces avermitilis TaxID=33903 RepID=Q82NA2_STRAW|nr:MULTISPECIES: hypothetical protein [Streptomyces]MYS97030.1 hypothetical protein [Streptomyces sp. SID5469]BAC69111.1 hypothetical protein SAVERM_1401 [Streptomyces avermitilis MA-4680 = NBRC 14893]BBJ49058.1 hypothetical protein SAVMC3_16870 [Streptomyces avermitilis]GDY61101.1 hypothetical protein SAV14893_004940 [Streptomyces avermitilis]GDY78820.1 hypothetical protein SAV31267_083050 [Streptomyces avermitilis]